MMRAKGWRLSAIRAVVAACGLCASAWAQLPANVLVVRADAPAGGDGLSWATAFNDLQAAIDAANAAGSTHDEVWVAKGSYVSKKVGTTAGFGGYYGFTPFILSGSLSVYGGFAGIEDVRSQRDIATNTTHIGAPYLLVPGPLRGVTLTMADDSLIDGFAITGTSAYTLSTSGIVMRGRSRIANSTVSGHCTCDGGGAAVEMHDDTVLDRCVVFNTQANWAGVAGVSAQDRARVISTRIQDNSSSSGSVSGVAGALGGASSMFIGCVFARNQTGSSGYGAALNGGVAVNCLFTGNSAGYPSSTVVQNATLINCTVVGNSFGCESAVRGVVINSVVWRNQRMPQCATWFPVAGPTVTGRASYSTVERFDATVPGVGSDGLDPLLDANGRLTPGSPAIDAGDNSALPPGFFMDLDGKPRFLGGVGASGAAAAPRVDRGPYEFGAAPPFCYANIDNSADTTPNAADFGEFLRLFRAGHPLANCDGSTGAPLLNAGDFVCFLNAFRAGCP